MPLAWCAGLLQFRCIGMLDTLLLHVRNSLNEPTSIHTHGMYQINTDFYDGAPMVTGCSIPPNANFTYIINTGNQKGSFWIHGHYYGHMEDGLRTPLIIHEKQPKGYDEDILFYLEDWGQKTFEDRMYENDQKKPGNLPSFYPTVLINGVNGNLTEPIKFVPGRKYRIRVVSMSGSFWFRFSMPGHKLHVVEADGIDASPLEVDGLDLGPGQRRSAIVTAHNSCKFNYLYNVTMYANFANSFPGLLPRHYSGSVIYNPQSPFKVPSKDQMVWSDAINMQAQDQTPLYPASRQIVWTVKERSLGYGIPYYSFKDYAYNRTNVPTLFTALTTGKLAFNSSIYGPQSQTFVVKHGEVIELLINNPGTKDHTIHLHMMDYQLIEVGPLGNAEANNRTAVKHQKSPGPYPMRLDSATLRAFSYIKIRFPVNRGFIALAHCHLETHMERGLRATIVAAPDLLQKHLRVPQAVTELCKMQGISVSGNAAGNQGFDMTGWDVGYLNVSRDGYSTWRAVGVNGKLPIPPIHVTQGDTLFLSVHNSLDVATSVHTHGMFHKDYSNFFDGTPMVTDCGIAPGESFTYVINTGEQTGTYWFHSHIYGQYVDGLRTPFIIHEKHEEHEEILMYLEDWGQTDFRSRAAQDKRTKLPDIPGFYPTALINGINGNLTKPISFVPGKTYRIRVACMSSSLWFKFRIPGHKLHVVEGDGVSTLPLEVDGLDLGPGQRISALVTALDSTEFNYLYNVTMYPGFASKTTLPRHYTGLVNYRRGAPVKSLPPVSDDSLVWSDFIDMQQKSQEALLPVDRRLEWTVREHATEYDLPYTSFGDYAYNDTLVDRGFVALAHCHIETHMDHGMGVTLVAAPDLLQKHVKASPRLVMLLVTRDLI
ncbi:ferroxidase fet3 [Coemansia sp. RSA 2336]|nr:ferroxidase fet3 [Coemansia sp. RSA 2336]